MLRTLRFREEPLFPRFHSVILVLWSVPAFGRYVRYTNDGVLRDTSGFSERKARGRSAHPTLKRGKGGGGPFCRRMRSRQNVVISV
jgi:hypothetical protein